MWQTLFCNCFLADIRTLLSGPMKSGMKVKGQRPGAQVVGHIGQKHWLAGPAQETGSNHLGWTGLHQLSASPGLIAIGSSL